jgi:hypothetical protein
VSTEPTTDAGGVVDLGWSDGKRKRKYVSGPTQSNVMEKLRQAQREAGAGVVADDHLTVGQFLQRWSTHSFAGAGVGHNAG